MFYGAVPVTWLPITDLALQDLPLESEEPAYEIWRKRIEAEFIARGEQVQRQKETVQ